ncbi:methyl-CpG-binding protein 2-like [Ruditapes philippinarum]|uniref:methyl-CpG-binding protein 2-like n=1 Tax=Ruditapes philippinarum TaxID=129788 RepID=UPI00295B6D58|nr:methyl-CpG-binding protein 2-like [Ruditapes philippinarum]
MVHSFESSPEGKKFRSRTELERYVEDAGINVDPQSIDFTVRGKKYSVDSKPKSEKKKIKPALSLTIKDNKSEKKLFPSPKKELKQLKSSPKKTNKTLSQKLVVKMKFAPPFKMTKTNGKRKKSVSLDEEEEAESNATAVTENEHSDIEDDLVKIKQPPPQPLLETKKQKVKKSKTKDSSGLNDTDPDLTSPPSKKRKISTDTKIEIK